MYSIQQKYQSLPVQVQASLWFLFCSFLQKGVAMITTPIFTRIMSTAEYGRFGVFNSWYGIFSIVIALSLSEGVHIQGLIKFDQERGKLSSSLLGLSTTLVLAWLFLYLTFQNVWNQLLNLSTIQMICMFIIIWSASIFGFWANEQRVNYSYKSLVGVTLLFTIMSTGLGIMLVFYMEDGATARIIGWAVASLICFSWMFVAQLKRTRVFFLQRFWKYALFFNLPLVPHYLSQTVLNSADRIMIQRMVGNSEAGIYNLAYSVALVISIFNYAIMQTLDPWIYKKIKDKNERDIAPIAYSTMLMIAGLNLFMILLAPEIIAIFAPKQYYDAIWVIPPVAISTFFMYAYDWYAKFAFYYEKTVMIMVASIIGAVLNIALNYIFIRKFGYIAAGYTTLICYAVYVIAHYIFMQKICVEYCDGRYPYETKKILMITMPFVLLGLSFLLLYELPVIRYSILVVGISVTIFMRKKIMEMWYNVMNVRKIY